jgi:hypothetical protein
MFDPEEDVMILRNFGNLIKDTVWRLRRPESSRLGMFPCRYARRVYCASVLG